jgi:hypothetical protein
LVLTSHLPQPSYAAPAAQNGGPDLIRIPPTCIGFNNGEIKTPDCFTATTTTTTVPSKSSPNPSELYVHC